MPSAVVDGVLRGREARVSESAYGDGDMLFVPFFGMEHVRSADGAEPEPELCPLVSGANVFRGFAGDLVWHGEGGESREDAPGSTLASEAVTDPDAERLAMNLDAQLAAGARGCSRRHGGVGVAPFPQTGTLRGQAG